MPRSARATPPRVRTPVRAIARPLGPCPKAPAASKLLGTVRSWFHRCACVGGNSITIENLGDTGIGFRAVAELAQQAFNELLPHRDDRSLLLHHVFDARRVA